LVFAWLCRWPAPPSCIRVAATDLEADSTALNGSIDKAD
jgi:hypothetical protein